MFEAVRKIKEERQDGQMLEPEWTQELREMSNERLQERFKAEMTDYMRKMLTRSSSSGVAAPTRQQVLKKSLIQKIMRGQGSDDELTIQKIASYINRELKAGWTGEPASSQPVTAEETAD